MVNQDEFVAVHNRMFEVAEEISTTGDTSKVEEFLHPSFMAILEQEKMKKPSIIRTKNLLKA